MVTFIQLYECLLNLFDLKNHTESAHNLTQFTHAQAYNIKLHLKHNYIVIILFLLYYII
jgi:hypothetical protein